MFPRISSVLPAVHPDAPRLARIARVFTLCVLAGPWTGCGDPPADPATPRTPAAAGAGAGTSAYDAQGRATRGRAATAPAPPHVVLFVLDGLRADALTSAGAAPPPMPLLHRWAAAGWSARRAFSASPNALSSLASLLTARLPSDHGLSADQNGTQRLHSVPTCAEILLNSAGYATEAWVERKRGNGPGSVLEGFERVEVGVPLTAVPERLRARAPGKRPEFLLIECSAASAPFAPRPLPVADREALARLGALPSDTDLLRGFALEADIWAALRAEPPFAPLVRALKRAQRDPAAVPEPEPLRRELRARWSEHMARVDAQLAEALQAVADSPALRGALVLVVGSRGEALGERGLWLEGESAQAESLHVPLLLRGATFDAPRTLVDAVSLMDVLPTLLQWLELPALDEVAGRSLLGSPPGTGERVALSQGRRDSRDGARVIDAAFESVRSSTWSFVTTYDRHHGTVVEEMYDLTGDPDAQRNLADERGRVQLARLPRPLPDEVCQALEGARDRLWGAVEGVQFMLRSGYAAGAAVVTDQRPERSCASPPER